VRASGTLQSTTPRASRVLICRSWSGWSAAGSGRSSGEAGSRTWSFASAIVVARLLGVAEYGAFALIQGTLAMLMTFATFGMGHTSARYIAALRNSDLARVEGINGLALLFAAFTGLVMTAALFLAAPHVATTVLGAPELTGPLRIATPILLLSALSGAAGGPPFGFEAFKQSTKGRLSLQLRCPTRSSW
jgi:O-antigen/teichoic acid export membrane protein